MALMVQTANGQPKNNRSWANKDSRSKLTGFSEEKKLHFPKGNPVAT